MVRGVCRLLRSPVTQVSLHSTNYDKGEDFSKLYSFSELSNGLKGGRYDGDQIPISCQKNKKYVNNGLVHVLDRYVHQTALRKLTNPVTSLEV